MTNFEILQEGFDYEIVEGLTASNYMFEDWWGNDRLDELEEKTDEVELFTSLLRDVKLVDSYGGEDQGSDYYKVYHFPRADCYIKFQGHYQSYNGADYESMWEVTKQEKTITVYE